MTDKVGREPNIKCRQARKRFAALDDRHGALTELGVTERAATNRHVQNCSRCALEYRLFALQRAALDAAAAAEPITPDEDFFSSLRARIARGPEPASSRPQDESWAAALLITATPARAGDGGLLLLMVGATLLWNQPSVELTR
jgi:predicted anti-sigma-YlaC factor YlaD